jgi:hypothetical protein
MSRMLTPQSRAFDEYARESGWPAYSDPGLEFEAPFLRDLLTLWRKLTAGAPLPRRAQLTPRVLKPYLGWISLIERSVDEPGRYRVRLMGSHLANAVGELQGKYLDEVLSPEVVLHWKARLELAEAAQGPMRFVSRVDIEGKKFLRSESFWAPLAGNPGAPPQFFMTTVLSLYSAGEFDPETVNRLIA